MKADISTLHKPDILILQRHLRLPSLTCLKLQPKMTALWRTPTFLQSDDPGMAEQVSWAADRPGEESQLLYYQADTAAYYGQLNKARDLSRQAVASAERAGRKEGAAGCEAAAGLREALLGNGAEAKRAAANALRASNGKDVQFLAALSLAMVSDKEKAIEFADSLKSRFT